MKRKSLTLLVCLLACLALGSVGFAAWVITNDANAQDTGTIRVDVVKDARLSITAEITEGEQIIFGAKEKDSSVAYGWMKYEETEDAGVKLNENLKAKIKIVIGNFDYLDTLTITLTEDTSAYYAQALAAEYVAALPVITKTAEELKAIADAAADDENKIEDGTLTVIETEILKYIGSWIKINEEIIYNAVPADIQADNADIFVNGEYYYAAIRKVPMSANVNVARIEDNKIVKLYTDKRIEEAVWLDNGSEVELTDGQTFKAQAFLYGTSGGIRVARFKLK